jgi:hypothetical protein
VWAIANYALARKRMCGGTWRDTIGRGALLTMLYLLIVIAIGWVATAALLSV